jgi:hypothetical protein
VTSAAIMAAPQYLAPVARGAASDDAAARSVDWPGFIKSTVINHGHLPGIGCNYVLARHDLKGRL